MSARRRVNWVNSWPPPGPSSAVKSELDVAAAGPHAALAARRSSEGASTLGERNSISESSVQI